jgi:hypothetical protein
MSRPSVRGASALALIVCAVAVLPPRGVHAAARPIVPEFMGNVGFDASQIAALERGEIVARILKTEMFRF